MMLVISMALILRAAYLRCKLKRHFLIPHIPEVLEYRMVDVRSQNKVPQLQP